MDGAILRHEFEVGPGGMGLLVRQPLPHEGQGFTFPGELRRRDRAPAAGRLVHGKASAVRGRTLAEWGERGRDDGSHREKALVTV